MLGISIINDEVSDKINELVEFLKFNKLSFVELRSINKKNISDLSLSSAKKIADLLKRKGIKVSSIASPLLKWPPDNSDKKINGKKVDNFYFKNNCDIEKIFKIAEIFNSKYIRIFSFLKYNGFRLLDLKEKINELLRLAEKYDKILLLENEPVCNIDSVDGLEKFIKYFQNDRIKILFDPGNIYKQGESIDFACLSRIKRHIEYVHIKDYSHTLQCYVRLGEGDINYKKILSFLGDKNIFYSLETHAGEKDRAENSAASIKKLKEIIGAKRVKYGIVGCGRVFRKHALAIKKNNDSELAAVYDIKNSRMTAAAKNNGCEYCQSLDELIDMVDVVNICTPHNTHAGIINKVLEKNKKCLCEKPGGLSKSDIKKIRKNKNYKNNVFVVFQNRFNRPIVEMDKIIQKRKMGDLLYIYGNVRWYRKKNITKTLGKG